MSYAVSDVFSLLFAFVSTFCCLVLIGSYLRYPVLRRFPSNLALWRAVADFIFSVQAVVFIFVDETFSGNDRQADLEPMCPYFVFVRHFAVSASLGWFFILTLNYFLSVYNPFVRPSIRNVKFHLWVWATSLITAGIASSDSSFRPAFQLCYTTQTEGVNWRNWLSFIGWIFVYWVASLGILAYCHLQLKDSEFKQLTKQRTFMLQFSFRNIVVFTGFWSVIGAVYFAIYLQGQPKDAGTADKDLHKAFVALFSCLGFVDFAVWYWTQKAAFEKFAKSSSASDVLSRSTSSKIYEQTLHQNDISEVLRKEFIQYTTEGITQSVSMHLRRRSSAHQRPKNVRLVARDTESGGGYDYRQLGDDDGVFDDLNQVDVIDIPPPLTLARKGRGNELFVFQDYSPKLFEELRSKIFRCSAQQYMQSLTGDRNDIEIMQEHFSEGRSGSFFYFSPDRRFIVKTLTKEEHSYLLKILLAYRNYLKSVSSRDDGYSQSLLTRFYGLYSIKMYHHTQFFVVMENCLWTPQLRVKIHERYDLKGSWMDRNVDSLAPPNAVRKDNDFKYKINIRKQLRQKMFIQVLRDSEFLAFLNIMDYSLLLGVHRCTEIRDTSKPHCSAVAETYAREHSQKKGTMAKPRAGTTAVNSSLRSSTTASPRTYAHSDRVDMKETDQEDLSNMELSDSTDPMGMNFRARTISISDTSVGSLHTAGTPSRRESDVLVGPRGSLHRSERMWHRTYYGGLSAEVMEGPGIFYAGIIDVLQQWNFSKRVEHYFKRLFKCYAAYSMSAIPPRPYAERFCLAMLDHLETSLAAAGGLPGVKLFIRDDMLDESPSVSNLPARQRQRYLVRLEFKGSLKLEKWEPLALLLDQGWPGVHGLVTQYRATKPVQPRSEMEKGRSSLYL